MGPMKLLVIVQYKRLIFIFFPIRLWQGMVIKMKSVEYMPFLLSFFLFLNGGIWSIYAVLIKDFYIGVWLYLSTSSINFNYMT